MITDDDILAMFEQADPARTSDVNDTLDATGYLAVLRTRSNTVTIIEPTETQTSPTPRRRWSYIAAIAAVALLVVGGLVLVARGDANEPDVPATVPPTTSATTPSAVGDAVGLAEQYLAAFATGDPDAVLDQQAPDFTMTYNWPGESAGAPLLPQEWLGAIHQAATSTEYVAPDCSIDGEDAETSTVSCLTTMRLAAHQAANADGTPAIVTITLSSSGVTRMHSAYGSNLDLLSFEEWKAVGRPALQVDPQTPDEMIAFGQAERQAALEWPTWAIGMIDAAFSAYNAGDLDGFFSGVRLSEAHPAFQGGGVYELSNCAPAGAERFALLINCDVVVRHSSHASSGVQATGTFELAVAVDGEIASIVRNVDVQPLTDFDTAFEQWFAVTYPDVHAQVTWLDDTFTVSVDDRPTITPYYPEFVEQSDVYPLTG